MADWSDDELEIAVRSYLQMLALQKSGTAFSKAELRRTLLAGPLSGRSGSSIEFRMRNITAVLEERGRETVRGYISADNVGRAVRQRIWTIVRKVDRDNQSPGGAPVPGIRTPPPIIYFNIGWMTHYGGVSDDDPTIGGHGWLTKLGNKYGAESFNFQPQPDGRLKGYRPPGATEKTNISKLGATRSADYIDGVLVVWIAREPATGRTRIIGWYKNARVFRSAQPSNFDFQGTPAYFTAEADANSCRLLPPSLRTFEVASSRTAPGEGFGQKPTWYGAREVDARVREYIENFGKPPAAARSGKRKVQPPRNQDPELRRKVERAAVDHAIAYFESVYGSDCRVDRVESEAKGWDLEVFFGAEPLLVEVKGLLNTNLVCELTPNEFSKMMEPTNRGRYIVYVLNNALAAPPAAPLPSVFEHRGGEIWQTSDGRELKIKPRTGAVLTV